VGILFVFQFPFRRLLIVNHQGAEEVQDRYASEGMANLNHRTLEGIMISKLD